MYFRRPPVQGGCTVLCFTKEVTCDTTFWFCYDYLRARNGDYVFGMPKLDACCGCIIFNVENSVEKYGYFKLLAVKATIIEDVKTLSQHASHVAL